MVETTTHFAAPERTTPEGCLDELGVLQANPTIIALLEAFPEPAVVLDEHRQIVLANTKIGALLGCEPQALIGQRPGEAVGCVHAWENAAGCGTGPACRFCGAGQTIVASQQAHAAKQGECRIRIGSDDDEAALELRVCCTPLDEGGDSFTIFAVSDNSSEKRRDVLERIFFHDALNVAGGVRALTEILSMAEGHEAEELRAEIHELSDRLVEEIQAQRDLTDAERGELIVEALEFDVQDVMEALQHSWARSPLAKGRTIRVEPRRGDSRMRTDRRLLRRVLENLLKNALEASDEGQTVTMGFEQDHDFASLTVHNETVMPESVRRQLFQRSFSTKGGSGRGVGTYSIRLLTTRYLRGSVSFSSLEGEGTTFRLDLPIALPD